MKPVFKNHNLTVVKKDVFKCENCETEFLWDRYLKKWRTRWWVETEFQDLSCEEIEVYRIMEA